MRSSRFHIPHCTMGVTNCTLRKTIAPMPKTPEEWLNEVSPEKPRGIFKLFLGYAPGVGKTYSMLSEAIRRASRGEDVVVGVVESHGRKATAELAGKLDRIPPRRLEYKGTLFDEMDVDAILARKPVGCRDRRTCTHQHRRQQARQALRRRDGDCWMRRSMCFPR